MNKINSIKDKTKNVFQTTLEKGKNLTNLLGENTMIKYGIYALIALTLFFILAYISYKFYLKRRNNEEMTSSLKQIPSKIKSIPFKNASNPLRDYYVSSSYNSCCGGEFKNDYVDTNPLQEVIKKGARLLDFEIYSINNKPVVSASSQESFNIKEMYNSIPFAEVIDTIRMHAFSGALCPNPNDPLFLNLRIKSNKLEIYEQVAEILKSNIGIKLLDRKYGYEANGEGIVKEPLNKFLGKIIIICDDKDGNFRKVDSFHKLVNMSSGSAFLRELRYYDVLYTPDFKELTYFNKKNMSIVAPDLSAKDENMNSNILFKYGCQFNCMCFQNADELLKYYLNVFNEAGYAFALKPEQLRYKPVTIKVPKKQNPAYSFAPRTIEKPYFKSLV